MLRAKRGRNPHTGRRRGRPCAACHRTRRPRSSNRAGLELATEARGADPFTPFVEHQDKYIVLLATGGTLTSLAQADTGSLAGGAQMDVWREIVTRDGALIADALNRGLFQRYLERAFPGRPVAAEFRLSNEKKPSATEVADLAGKLKAAGWSIDQDELQEAVGYTLVKDEIEKVGGESRWTEDGRIPLSTSTSSLAYKLVVDSW